MPKDTFRISKMIKNTFEGVLLYKSKVLSLLMTVNVISYVVTEVPLNTFCAKICTLSNNNYFAFLLFSDILSLFKMSPITVR